LANKENSLPSSLAYQNLYFRGVYAAWVDARTNNDVSFPHNRTWRGATNLGIGSMNFNREGVGGGGCNLCI
jgi:hypothetical protein